MFSFNDDYLSNDAKVIIFRLRLTEKFGGYHLTLSFEGGSIQDDRWGKLGLKPIYSVIFNRLHIV